jgi:hypothetical protein
MMLSISDDRVKDKPKCRLVADGVSSLDTWAEQG